MGRAGYSELYFRDQHFKFYSILGVVKNNDYLCDIIVEAEILGLSLNFLCATTIMVI